MENASRPRGGSRRAGAHHTECVAARAEDVVRVRRAGLRDPNGARSSRPAARAPTARTTRGTREHASAAANAASTTMPSGSSTTRSPSKASARCTSHRIDPAHLDRGGADLVERAFPLGDAEAGLLLHLTGEAGAQGRVGGVDHPARRAPVGGAAAPLVADQQQAVGRLQERTGDGELARGPCPQCRARTDLPAPGRGRPHQVTSRKASTTMRPDIFDRPRLRSRNSIGTSTMRPPLRSVR